MNSSVFSEDHRRAGECLRVMMKHNQMSMKEGMEAFGVSYQALSAYRSGANGIPYKIMLKMIEVMQPSERMRLNFISAVRMSAQKAWELYGESPKVRKHKALMGNKPDS